MLRNLAIGVLVILFWYTGSSKLLVPESFRSTLYNQPIPHGLAEVLVWLVPAAELLIGIGLLFDRTRRAALYSALALLIGFTGYIAGILLHFFRKIPCSCGGIFRGLSWQQHFAVNLLLITIAGIALIKKSISSPLNVHL